MDTPAPDVRPNWRVEVTPSASNLTDYFLNVLTATTTNVNSPPRVSLIRSQGVYGAQIIDRQGMYVAVFPTSINEVSLQYSTVHSGPAIHVASGLKAGKYIVTQNGAPVSGIYVTDAAGSISFHENGGGNFQVSVSN